MSLKGLLRKKNKSDNRPQASSTGLAPPEFKFIRSDTYTQEDIEPPSFGDSPLTSHSEARYAGSLHCSSSASNNGSLCHEQSPQREKDTRRISHRLRLGRRSRSGSASSVNIPTDLPSVANDSDAQEREAQWEKRATLLAQGPISVRPSSPVSPHQRPRSPSTGRLSGQEDDVDIQEAIRLHEAGELTRSTEMFKCLADPNGQNNALSQVLYGLALRHGWGCERNPESAVTYLSAAAANCASIEAEALNAGIKKGGSAKGELVLAIFELANCLRHGWGIAKDPVAARQYYETAANLGDTDAMNEVAWCYLEGFGGKKDKYVAAKYYRLAEDNGSKTLGNTWIWKEKYNSK
ncbi:hypothetical protein D8B26_003698 [Coccidioides posadasii str. Silveira]|uniref:Uncharacterized protein n=3 Tax=Coccidioides posadasii TaxID=199306 RepID=E9DIJ5_COCPS|nr:hypothetical protein CPC735_074030 [Coccidioides posadasii C735 delta SOWgp]EER29721.1 hypothetical protein CPC735_074030 [Coccidioides posadasii C735 delta SOWgp]EFW13777.1 conserved hypothetical protein [Coccidioides posadasii str. Silveira]KMM69802.1 hypothetical protein CPAG_06115 [Coccidioides posadasii RMSCC 3488]QVM09029.1 hypothetical protein D8B26_003698 [Coccidioides posadasii str. Silveira]|eukprot:XP_003071866.1 hypothetical protein CPC735_074030 [Coccidioides posadasii C735 delta SOWgp]